MEAKEALMDDAERLHRFKNKLHEFHPKLAKIEDRDLLLLGVQLLGRLSLYITGLS